MTAPTAHGVAARLPDGTAIRLAPGPERRSGGR